LGEKKKVHFAQGGAPTLKEKKSAGKSLYRQKAPQGGRELREQGGSPPECSEIAVEEEGQMGRNLLPSRRELYRGGRPIVGEEKGERDPFLIPEIHLYHVEKKSLFLSPEKLPMDRKPMSPINIQKKGVPHSSS